MTLYLGKKAVCPTKIVKKEIAKVKYGVTIDDILGDVDADGVYTSPTDEFVLDLAGMKSCGSNAFEFFAAANLKIKVCVALKANDLVSPGNRSFANFADGNRALKAVEFNSLESASDGLFQNAFPYVEQASFPKLKIVYPYSFNGAFSETAKMEFDKVFPALEIIKDQSMSRIIKTSSSSKADIRLSKVIEVYGGSSGTTMTIPFYGTYCILYLPRCTYVNRYILHKSYNLPLHFAAQNQVAIEACTGYEYKFGASEIYFDLMLNIIVNGTTYDREHTIDGYTSWKDSNGNLVYTNATAEPAVGTIVYADQGTTQVGTVEGVA